MYTKSVVEFSLQEGLKLAQHDPRLQVDVFSLNPQVPSDLKLINDFKTARAEIVQKTIDLIDNRTLMAVNLQSSDIDGAVGVVGARLALLPPNFSARVNGWGQDVKNKHKCETSVVTVPHPENSQENIQREVCTQSGNFTSTLKQYPTEFHAYATMRLPLLGTIKSDFMSSTYLIPASTVNPPTVVPPHNPTTTIPAGTVVGGYSFNFQMEGRGNGGVIYPVSESRAWGKTRIVSTIAQKTIYACASDLATVYIPTQQYFAPGYTPPISGKFWAAWDEEATMPRISTGAVGWNQTISIASFHCVTP
jgi:hypothetical protein